MKLPPTELVRLRPPRLLFCDSRRSVPSTWTERTERRELGVAAVWWTLSGASGYGCSNSSAVVKAAEPAEVAAAGVRAIVVVVATAAAGVVAAAAAVVVVVVVLGAK